MSRLKFLQRLDRRVIPVSAAAPMEVEAQAGEPLLYARGRIDRIYSSNPDLELVILHGKHSAARAGIDRNVDAAFGALEKAFATRSQVALIKADPKLDNLRSDPRYADLLLRIGLTQ